VNVCTSPPVSPNRGALGRCRQTGGARAIPRTQWLVHFTLHSAPVSPSAAERRAGGSHSTRMLTGFGSYS